MTFEQTVQELVREGLAEIECKYGQDGRSPKAYHNVGHAQDVMDAGVGLAEAACQSGKITERDVHLVRLAACYHDIDQDLPRGDREDESTRILVNKMCKFGVFTDEDVVKVSAMIDATKVEFIGGKIVQNYTDDYLTKILADSDLSAFGQPFDMFWDRSLKLAAENGLGQVESDANFLKGQIDVLTKHHFATAEASELLIEQTDNVTQLKKLLKHN